MNAEWLAAARAALGIDQLALIVFDACLPPGGAPDLGVGSPYGEGAREFFEFGGAQGFNAIQFGPQGWMSEANASPYDGASFSRNPMSLCWDLSDTWPELCLGADEVATVLSGAPAPGDSHHARAHRIATRLGQRVHERFRKLRVGRVAKHELVTEFEEFCGREADWLVTDGLYVALMAEHGGQDYQHWPASEACLFADAAPTARGTRLELSLADSAALYFERLRSRFAHELEQHALSQFLLARQHASLLTWAHASGLELYGDLQTGTSRMDSWQYASLFLPGYRLGAPPSRTNPEGQPWGYPVFRPELLERAGANPGPALCLQRRRAERMFENYDRVRLDHPHALVCPWVYSATTDAVRAVQEGARLYSSPADPRHPELAAYSIVTQDDIDPGELPYADKRIRRLSPVEVERFARVFDGIVACAGPRGSARLLCEVLSTEPVELRAVRLRHGLGCFRVTQKADVRNPSDRYASENAREEDWILMGNHDTPTIWGAIRRWQQQGTLADHADYLAHRLAPADVEREPMARRLREDAGELATAQLADALHSAARHVLVSSGDLLGLLEPYNVPGVVSSSNWSQRISPDFAREHADAAARGSALSVPRALQMALAARNIALA
jgi:4-alpha-glucanotransferase